MPNTPPSLTNVQSISTSENQLNFGAVSLLTGAQFADPDGNLAGGTLTVRGVLAGERIGHWGFSGNVANVYGTPIGTFTGGDGSDLVLTFNANATTDLVRDLLRDLYYSSASDAPPASRQLVINITDAAGADLGPLAGNPSQRGVAVNIAIEANNDAPLVDLNGPGDGTDHAITQVEGVVTRLAPNAVVTDPDSASLGGGVLTVTANYGTPLSVVHQGNGAGQIGVSGNTISYGGVVIGTNSSAYGGLLQIQLTSAAIPGAVQALVRQIGYCYQSSTPPSAPQPVTITLSDNLGASSYGGTVTVTVEAVNEAPALSTGAIGEATYNDGWPAAPIDWGIQIVDPDDSNLVSATVRITGGYRMGEDELRLNEPRSGIATSWDAATGTLTLTATGPTPVYDWQFALQTVGFRTAGNTPGPRTISFTVNDGEDTSNTHVRTLTVQHINDAPTVDLDGGGGPVDTTVYYTEHGPPLAIAPNATISDIDSTNFAGGHLRVVQSGGAPAPENVLAVDNQGTGAGQIGVNGSAVTWGGVTIGTIVADPGAPLAIALNAAATSAAVQALLRAITYQDGSGAPNIFYNFAVQLVEADGVSGSALTTVRIEQVDDPLVFDPNGDAPGTSPVATYPIGVELVPIAPLAIFDDPDTNFANSRLEVRITNPASGDTLGMFISESDDSVNIHEDGTISYDGMAVGTITLTSAVSGSILFSNFVPDVAVEAVLRSIGYGNIEAAPSGTRNILYTLSTIGAVPLSFTATVNIVAAGTPVANPDAASTIEGASVTISALANDVDSDGPSPAFATINGAAVSVGSTVALASGATATVNANGTLTYNPGTAFDYLIAPNLARALGAANGSATDSFTYGLVGGGQTIVGIRIDGATDANDMLRGAAVNDRITGTSGSNLFDLSQGGVDTAFGGGGDDGFYFGAQFTAADMVDGGEGTLDQLGLQGDYSGGLTLTAGSLVNVEMLVLLPGNDARFGHGGGGLNSYAITTIDANVDPNEILRVSFNTLRVGENVYFDGSRETDGSFLTFGGLGNDLLTGGQRSDGFFFGTGGRFGAGDRINGQGGTLDQLGLQGVYSGSSAIRFGIDQLVSIEMIVLLTGGDTRFGGGGVGYSYDLTMHDGNVASGAQMQIQANQLRADETLTFNGAAETDGRFVVYAGAGNDSIIGGSGADTLLGLGGNDLLRGGLGADLLRGGAGNDVFDYDRLIESNAAGMDQILDFASGDRIDLSTIDANANLGGEQAFAFIGAAAFSAAGQVRVIGSGADWTVQADVNGDGVADLVIAVTQASAFAWAAGDFIL